jgi:hypothetical protein
VIPTLIYCADGNRRFAEIAIRHGFEYGAQLPNTCYFKPHFVDQNWRDPKRADYMQALAKYRPALATVLDLEHEHQLGEVLSWAEEAAQYVSDSVIIIPKVIGITTHLPRAIGGRPVRLGYSASSTFSGTPVSLGEFRNWPVHCLGGSVATQMNLTRGLDVRSADGNYIQTMARRHCAFYSPGFRAKHHGWPKLKEVGLSFVRKDAIYLAFELTCIAIQMAWRGKSGASIYRAQLAHLDGTGVRPSHIQTAFM